LRWQSPLRVTVPIRVASFIAPGNGGGRANVIGEGSPEEKAGEEPEVHSHPCVVLACNRQRP